MHSLVFCCRNQKRFLSFLDVQSVLLDSIEAVMSLSPFDLRKIWRFEFLGEIGIDAGGLAREWFQLVTEAIFDPGKFSFLK